MKTKRKRRIGEIEALEFDKLPQRCKEIYFEYMSYSFPSKKPECKALFSDIVGFDVGFCESPIEKIFLLAFMIVSFDSDYDCPWIDLMPQYEICIGNRMYRADFLFSTDCALSENYVVEKKFDLVIECDGHDFHEKNKEQVKHDNERDYDLKINGYDVLRFSGSQIYNEPFICASKAFSYIVRNVGKIEKITD